MFYNTCSGPLISVVYRFYHKNTSVCLHGNGFIAIFAQK